MKILAFIVIALVIGMAFALAHFGPHERVYDCSLSEISPDFPKAVREECRKLRSTTWVGL